MGEKRIRLPVDNLKVETNTMQKTIIFIDDSLSIRSLVKTMFEQTEFQLLLSSNGQDALQFLDGRVIHLILTDLHMPQLDGIGFTKEVRKREAYQSVPILLLTTESQLDKKKEAKAAGASGWLIKPFNKEKLLKTVYKITL